MNTTNLKSLILVFAFLVLMPDFGLASKASDQSLASRLHHKIAPLIGPNDSVIIKAPNGVILLDINGNKALVPASILKILTCMAALDTFGSDYRFKTDFYMDGHQNLIIKGYGDPLLISERLQTISAHLSSLMNSVQNIVLDDSYFAQPVRIPGRGSSSEPYDAPNGALCVNFNTVAFKRSDGRWISAEPQTPLLVSVIPRIETSGLSSGRITLTADSAEAVTYTGELFKFFLEKNGIKVLGGIEQGQADFQKHRLIWRYQSEDNLGQIISQLLEFSNNFIANQILLTMGAQSEGAPATMEKGLSTLKKYYRQKINTQSGRLKEASGLSRQNRITGRDMIKIMDRFLPHRKLMRKNGRRYYKTGHLKGIRTNAGYITSKDGSVYRFVVMLNTPGKTTHRIIQIMEKNLP